MPLNGHRTTNYINDAKDLIREFEGYEPTVYYNNNDTPTIGYGLALYDKNSGRIVQNAFDFIKQENVFISESDHKLFKKIETAMQANPRNNNTIKNLVGQLSVNLGSEATASNLLNRTLPHYESLVERSIGTNLYNSLENTKELAALVDMAYNAGTSLFGPGLKHALTHENRAEAWFQIRYDSNADNSNGIARRRVAESNMFGLYDAQPTAEGMKDIIRMARFHETKINHEENAFPAQYAGDNTLSAQIQPAKDYLIEHFGKGVMIDGELIVGNDTINDNSANRGRTKIDDVLKGTKKNDLIFGEKGNDTLRGYAGDDVMYGGEGKDKLYGGSGNDTYMAGAGDTINDSDKQGQIYFNANLLSGVKHKTSEGVYEDKMFSYTEKDKSLIIAQKDDPTKSITVEDWDKSKKMLDIELSDEKEQVETVSAESLGVAVDVSKLTLIQKEDTTDYSKYLPEHIRSNQEEQIPQSQNPIHPPSVQEYLAQFETNNDNVQSQNLDNQNDLA